jgi:hypothetical protein
MGLSLTVTPSAFLISLALMAPLASASVSKSAWSPGQVVGEIDGQQLPEASGLAASRIRADILYHVNDAGSSPSVVLTDGRGEGPQTVNLSIAKVTDTEDLATGPCPDQGSCLYIADIGDNNRQRAFITVHVVREEALVAAALTMNAVTPAFTLDLVYPDGASYNAESLALHPSGFVYLLTKEIPAVFYRFPLNSFSKSKPAKPLALEEVGFVNLLPWLEGSDRPQKIIPTSMAIRPDGKQLVVLTRSAGISFDVDLAKVFNSGNQDLNKIIEASQASAERLPMIRLPQSEAVTYINQGASILYSSEIVETGDTRASLVQLNAE